MKWLTAEREDPFLRDDQNTALPSSREQRFSLAWTSEVLYGRQELR